jgi:hypothetical protein
MEKEIKKKGNAIEPVLIKTKQKRKDKEITGKQKTLE